MEDINSTEEQQQNSKVPPQLQPHVYKKGQSGNPSGRPKGISLKEYAKMKLASMTDDEREEFFQGIDKRVIWEMAEGKAESKTDLTSGGQPIQFVAPEVVANRINESSTNTTS